MLLLQSCSLLAAGSRGIQLLQATDHINTGSTVTPAKPSLAGAGMQLLGIMASGDGGSGTTWTPASGFTERADLGGLTSLAIAGRTVDGSEGSSFAFTAGAIDDNAAQMLLLRRAAYAGVGSFGTLTGAGTLVVPSYTMPGAGKIIIAVATRGNGTIASDTGLTAFKSIATSGYPHIATFEEDVPAGATGTRNFTIGGIPQNAAGIIIGFTKA